MTGSWLDIERSAKRAGDTIRCPRCGGKGYTLQGLMGDMPIECSRCRGRGHVEIQPSRYSKPEADREERSR